MPTTHEQRIPSQNGINKRKAEFAGTARDLQFNKFLQLKVKLMAVHRAHTANARNERKKNRVFLFRCLLARRVKEEGDGMSVSRDGKL